MNLSFQIFTLVLLSGILALLTFIYLQHRRKVKSKFIHNIVESKEYYELKSRFDLFVALTSIILLIIGFSGFSTFNDFKTEVRNELNQELDSLNIFTKSLKSQLNMVDSNLSTQKNELDFFLTEVSSESNSAKSKISTTVNSISEIQEKLEKLNNSIPRQKIFSSHVNNIQNYNDFNYKFPIANVVDLETRSQLTPQTRQVVLYLDQYVFISTRISTDTVFFDSQALGMFNELYKGYIVIYN